MKLLTSAEHKQLLANAEKCRWAKLEHIPVVRLATSDNSCFWYITSILNSEKAFGLTKLCGQEPTLGFINPNEVFAIGKKLNTKIVKTDSAIKDTLKVIWIVVSYEYIIDRIENGLDYHTDFRPE